MQLLRSYARLPHAQRMLLIRALLLVTVVRLALWLLPFRLVYQLLERVGGQVGQQYPTRSQLEAQHVWAVAAVSRYVPGATCLTQALSLRALLARAGVQSELRIGVAKNSHNQLEAHAWVVREERILIGALPDMARYVPLPSLEGRRI
jgi:hypothetical protein